MKVIGVIPARYSSTRVIGKPLVIICGKPMVWWVYQRAVNAGVFDEIVVATDDEIVINACKELDIKAEFTSPNHQTPTSRIYEISTKIDGDLYAFISGDEPLIDSMEMAKIVNTAKECGCPVTNGMTKIKTAPEVIDSSNIKVTVSSRGLLLYTTRSPIPFPKGGLDYDYMKFSGIGVFTKDALLFFNETPRGKLETIEECDLMRFIDKGLEVRMVELFCRNISVDTYKDLELVREIMEEELREKVVKENNR